MIKKWLKLSKFLLGLGDSLRRAHIAKNPTIKNAFQGIVLFFFVKSYLTFRAIYILASNGLGFDAGMLLRSLFENLITLSYISKNPKEYSQLYLKYSIVARKNLLDLIKKDDKWFGPIRKRIEEEKREEIILQEYGAIKDDYPNKFSWSGKTIMQMADEVNLKIRPANSELSSILHSNPLSMDKYIKEDADGGFVVNLNPKDDYLEVVLPVSYTYFLAILDKFNEVFDLRMEEKIKLAEKKMNELRGE